MYDPAHCHSLIELWGLTEQAIVFIDGRGSPVMQCPSVALLTQHGKQTLIQPCFSQLGWHFIHTQAFDTDSLGTFSGEIPRKLSPLECAEKKASIACDIADTEYGLGSEGSFSPSPFGVGTANLEVIACVHRTGRLVAVGYHEAPFFVDSVTITSNKDKAITAYVENLTPGQGSILLVNGVAIAKGIRGAHALREWISSLTPHMFSQGVEITYDLRAHLSPPRQFHICEAALELGKKLNSHCPNCNEIGFWPEHREPGLLCQWCRQPTMQTKAKTATCGKCNYQHTYPVDSEYASPQYCNNCNP